MIYCRAQRGDAPICQVMETERWRVKEERRGQRDERRDEDEGGGEAEEVNGRNGEQR